MRRLLPLILLVLAGCGSPPPPPASAAPAPAMPAEKHVYVASSQREPFHRPTCEWAQKIPAGNRVVYQTRDDALNAGKRICKVCQP